MQQSAQFCYTVVTYLPKESTVVLFQRTRVQCIQGKQDYLLKTELAFLHYHVCVKIQVG